MTLAASRLLDIKTRYGAEAVVFGIGTPAGTATSDYWDWLLRLANAFGSPNFTDPIYICAWNWFFGSQYTYGVMRPPPDYDHARCILLWGHNPEASWPAAAMRISQARSRGAKLIVIDPRQHSLAQKADCWLQVRPGSDGALALGMIHVLLEEALYDAAFARDWTNGPFLVRADTHQLLTAQDLAPSGTPETFVVWDGRSGGPAHYHTDRGYAQEGVAPALSGTYTFTLADGHVVECRPAFELLKELAAQYAPERSEELTWVPAGDVRRAVRLFATEQPSCYNSWVGIEQHTNAMQINRAVCLFYALTGQFDRAWQQCTLRQHPHQSHYGARVASPGAGRATARRCRASPGAGGQPGDCASLRRVSRHPHRATLPGEGPGHLRDRPAPRPRGPVARQGGPGGPGLLCARRHVCQSQRGLRRPAAARLHLLGARGPVTLLHDRGRYRHLGAAQAARGPAAARVAIGPGDPL